MLCGVPHLRCNVVRCATEGFRGGIRNDLLLAHAKVRNFDVAILNELRRGEEH